MTMKIAVAENSAIICSGVTSILKRLPDLRIQPFEVYSLESLKECLKMDKIDMLIINPAFGGFFDISKFRAEIIDAHIKIVALVSSYVDKVVLGKYDETLSVYDNNDVLYDKINRLQNSPEKKSEDGNELLSTREKEIVVCVVKGMTNKEIADNLFISVHTVITHRRNIAKKLQIHSPAGLTIYAIVNNLIEIGEVKKNLV